DEGVAPRRLGPRALVRSDGDLREMCTFARVRRRGDAQKKSEGSPTITGFPHGAGRESTSPRMLPETWRGPHPPSARGSFHFARIWRSSSAVRWKLLAPEGIAFGLEPRLSAESACDHIRLQPACHDARRDGSPNEPGITGGS